MSGTRGLVVLADGTHAAFAAGAVAELALHGRRWDVAAGAGLGAQVGVLAVLGEAEEAARRWRRQGEQGCPLLASVAEEGERRLHGLDGTMAMLDPWRLPGWLDPVSLAEHLAPEAGGVPARLRRCGARALVLTLAVDSGHLQWDDVGEMEPESATAALISACTFPAGWGAHEGAGGRRWGGVGLLSGAAPEWLRLRRAWDVVCGFPLPAVEREWLSTSLLEQVQRRDEVSAALAVGGWVNSLRDSDLRVVAPSPDLWRRVEGRDDAELGVEYPLAWERNGELVARLLAAGAAAAALAAGNQQ